MIEKPFAFFPNNSNTRIADGDPPVVSGDVDIVVGIRDPGFYAHSKDTRFGDRLAVSRIEYDIIAPAGDTVSLSSVNFDDLILRRRRPMVLFDYERVATVFKFYSHVKPEGLTSFNGFFSYYVITNNDGTGQFGLVDVSDVHFSWTTAEVDGQGGPRYPNGEYEIVVRAYDAHDNEATATDTVRVEN